jgi:hypothetical protein
MRLGDPIPAETLRERACLLTRAPRVCDPSTTPGCRAADRLADLSKTLCADPMEPLPEYRLTDYDIGIR